MHSRELIRRNARLMAVSALFLLVLCLLLSCIWLRNQRPVAVVLADRTSGEAPFEVVFDASQSYDPDGDSVSFDWDFGDGGTAEGVTASHGFGSPGNYAVWLVVTDSLGNSDSATVLISVTQASSVTDSRQEFNAASGIEFISGSGLGIAIQPQEFDEVMTLIVEENPTPQQPQGGDIKLLCVYDITVESSHPPSTSSLGADEESKALSGVRLTVDIPLGVNPATAVILEWTSGGWVLAGSGQSLGGTLTSDGQHIYVDLPHLSTYASGSFESIARRVDWSTAGSKGWANPLGEGAELHTYSDYDYDSDIYLENHGRRHTGIDIHAGEGDPVYAIADGVVIMSNAGTDAGANVIIVAHRDSRGDTFLAIYGHVMPTLAEPESPGFAKAAANAPQEFEEVETLTPKLTWHAGGVREVSQGQQIAEIVRSGLTLDPEKLAHLHLGINTSSGTSGFMGWKTIIVDGSPKNLKFGWGKAPEETKGMSLSEWGWVDPVEYLNSHSPSVESPPEDETDGGEYGLYVRDIQAGALVVNTIAEGIDLRGTSYSLPPGKLGWDREYRWNMSTDDSSGRRHYSDSTLHFTTTSESPVVVPTSLTITGPSQVGEGDTETYTCAATFSDGGSKDVTSQATWDLSVSSSYATISNGQLTAKTLSSDRSCTITASYEDNGATEFATKTITLKNDPPVVVPTSLTISGPDHVDEGETETYACIATFSNNTSRDVTNEASWDLSVSSSYATISNGQLTAKSLSSDKSCTVTASYTYNGTTKNDSMSVTLRDVLDPRSLSFTGLSPSTISTSQSTYQATLQATGSNFLNVNRVSYSWSGPDSGSMTWYKGDSNWNSAVVVGSDGSMTLKPVVLSNATGTQSQTWNWTVTLRDNTGATVSRSFTVTYDPPEPGIHVGDRVESNQNLNVRQCADAQCLEITDPDYIGYAPSGTEGTVLDGPESADGYTWWEVQWDAGYTGWSVENGLDEI